MAFYALRGRWGDILHERLRDMGKQRARPDSRPSSRLLAALRPFLDRQGDSLSDPQAFWTEARLWRLAGRGARPFIPGQLL